MLPRLGSPYQDIPEASASRAWGSHAPQASRKHDAHDAHGASLQSSEPQARQGLRCQNSQVATVGAQPALIFAQSMSTHAWFSFILQLLKPWRLAHKCGPAARNQLELATRLYSQQFKPIFVYDLMF